MTKKSHFLLFPLLFVLYEVALYLSNDMYLPALPQMMTDLGLSIPQAQFTLTAWFFGAAMMPLVMGAISDRYGRRRVLLTGGGVYILATIACALTTNPTWLLLARVLEGAMVPSALVPGYATVHDAFEQKDAIRILAWMGSIVVLAPALGPLFGGLVLLVGDWRAIFWLIAVLSLAAILFLYRFMPETLPVEERRPIQFNELFKQYGRVLRNKHYILQMAVLGFIFGGFLCWITAGPLLVIISFKETAIAFGIMQAVVFAAYILGTRCVKRWLDTLGVHALIQVGLAITFIGGLLTVLMGFCFPNQLWLFIAAMMIYSFGSALCFAPLNRSIIEASNEPMSSRVALFSVFLTSFAGLGSIISGFLFNGTIVSLAMLIAAAGMIACTVWLILQRSHGILFKIEGNMAHESSGTHHSN